MSSAQLTPLVIRFGAFGDMVLMIPVLKFLHQRYGRPCDVVGSGAWTEPLLQRVPSAAARFYLSSRRAPYWFNRSQWAFVAWLRRRAAGPVYVFEPDEKPLALLRRAGVSAEWICSLRDFPRATGEHILAHALRLAHATPTVLRGDAALSTLHLQLSTLRAADVRPTLSEADRQDCAAWMLRHRLGAAPLVLLQPGNKKTMKRGERRRASNVDYWPESHWARVIEGVRATLPAAQIVLCGSPAERALGDEIAALVPAHRAYLTLGAAELPIPRLLALQERAHSMISVNTGPAHSAAAMGCPLVVMFTRHAHRAADLYAPVATSAPLRILQPPADAADPGLSSISPAAVVTTWQSLQS